LSFLTLVFFRYGSIFLSNEPSDSATFGVHGGICMNISSMVSLSLFFSSPRAERMGGVPLVLFTSFEKVFFDPRNFSPVIVLGSGRLFDPQVLPCPRWSYPRIASQRSTSRYASLGTLFHDIRLKLHSTPSPLFVPTFSGFDF